MAADSSPTPQTWPSAFDLLLAVFLSVMGIITAFEAADVAIAGYAEPRDWWQWLVLLIPSAAVAFWRTAPIKATPVAVIAQLVVWGIGLATLFPPPLVLIYSDAALGTRAGRRMAIGSAFVLTAMAAIGVFVAPDVGVDAFLLTALSGASAILLGESAARQRIESAHLAADLAVERMSNDAARERAVVRERQRIAHELHDLVGHSLSIIAVRTEAAKRVGDNNPEAVRAAIDDIDTIAKDSLAEVRRVLHAEAGNADAALHPTPTLEDVPALVDSVAATGYDVTLNLHGPIEPTDVDTATGSGIYRIVQEALTNVIKHGGPNPTAHVDIDVGPDEVRVDVINDGRVSAQEQTAGLGLVGMAERARFLGGTFDAGAIDSSGFRVQVAIPTGVKR